VHSTRALSKYLVQRGLHILRRVSRLLRQASAFVSRVSKALRFMLGELTNEPAGSRNRWKSNVVEAALRDRPSFCYSMLVDGVGAGLLGRHIFLWHTQERNATRGGHRGPPLQVYGRSMFRHLVRLSVGFVAIVERFVFFQNWQFDCDVIARWFLQVISEEANKHDRNVIFTTSVVGFGNQLITGRR